VQIIQNYAPERIVYANRSAPRGMTVVPREAFVSSRPTRDVVIELDRVEASRAPFMGMTAAIAPQRESIIVRTPAATPIAQPPRDLSSRPVVSRQSASPAPVPFDQQQRALAQNPGRPLAPADIVAIQQRQTPTPTQPVRVLPQQAPNANTDSPGVAPRSVAPQTSEPRGAAPRATAPQATDPRAAAPRAAAPAEAGSNGAAAISLVATLKGSSFPAADRRLSEARNVAGIRLDFNALSLRLASLKQGLAQADQEVASKNYDKALQSANSIQGSLAVLMNEIEAAMQTTSRPSPQTPSQSPDQTPRRSPGRPAAP